MPRSLEELEALGSQLSDEIEQMGIDWSKTKDATSLRAVGRAAEAAAALEGVLLEAVTMARRDGCSWAHIGVMLRTSGEAARQRYGPLIEQRQAEWRAWLASFSRDAQTSRPKPRPRKKEPARAGVVDAATVLSGSLPAKPGQVLSEPVDSLTRPRRAP